MKWKVGTTKSGNEAYHLMKNGIRLLSLTLNPSSKTARINTTDDKRVFQIRKEGMFRNRTVLRNEYGIKMGALGVDAKGNFIDIEQERFYYNMDNASEKKLTIFKENANQPVAECMLDEEDASFHLLKEAKNIITHPVMLMALCWYLVMPVAEKL